MSFPIYTDPYSYNKEAYVDPKYLSFWEGVIYWSAFYEAKRSYLKKLRKEKREKRKLLIKYAGHNAFGKWININEKYK